MDFFRISITVVSAITITLCESVVADVSAKDTTTPKIILASYDEFPITPYQLVTEALQIIGECIEFPLARF